MAYKLPELGYAYDALEPFIDARTMKIHHTKHHQAYIDKLNNAIRYHKRSQNKTPERLLISLKRVPKEIRDAVRNNAGGHVNHSFFWPLLRKNIKPKAEILKAIKKEFGNFETFKGKFSESALKLFGSGWTWFVLSDNGLEILNTQNQDNPLSEGKIPILGLDIWEHAYYIKYQNKRADYIEAFFHIINWEQVNKNYNQAMKKIYNGKLKNEQN
jgi:Fe-Mn family superoxide dismutase